ncbi:splicing factor ESS-2 homolog [Dendroctonus ponderosae]|uniref:Splicing factor ESS-2 homolog n=1 Tax=Dendroctonus ponderosae TaxID=77166 RepID=U4UAF3_DENPD|nr:splicing factor ESS-2 homolog [Dendroctonus ponderosae]ERL86930.1 hypothetical protein D910_04333 [Dendroctonus ponderosae]KAH1018208.1 hypothetical protein HUJ05_006020 [Dendroctonus ponderosae]
MSDSVENTPGQRAIEVMETIHKEIVFKVPTRTARKRPKVQVLEEETYVEEIANIIQRDFFPELEKIKAQNEYLDAMERNDTVRLRELYMKYSGRRPPTERMPSPATFETPNNLHGSEEDIPQANGGAAASSAIPSQPATKPLSLDQYLNSHTSQDNESFEEILETSSRKLQEKYKYLYGVEQGSEESQSKMLALPSIQQQAAPVQKPLNLDTWGYKNRNYLMFNPDGVELSAEEELKLIKDKQEITYENTRLRLNPFNEVQSKETINELAKTQAKVLDGKIGVDGKELQKPETPRVGGFRLIRSPSPSPSLLASPLMTWGEIEGTPFRLDGGDTPLPRSKGPSFKMSEPPRREQLAFALAERVGEKNRDQKKRALDAQRRQFSTPSPRPNSSTIERLASMSPAARRLATAHLKLPGAGLLSPRTPQTPKLAKTPTPKRATTPKLDLGIKKMGDKEVSTDDLLKIPVPARKSAADFF